MTICDRCKEPTDLGRRFVAVVADGSALTMDPEKYGKFDLCRPCVKLLHDTLSSTVKGFLSTPGAPTDGR